MLKRYQNIVGGTFRIIDVCIVGSIWLISYWLRFYVPLIKVTKGFPPFEKYAALTPLVMFLWAIVFSSMGLYRSRRMLRRTHEAHLIIKAHIVASLALISLTYLFSEYRYSRVVMFYFGLLGGFSLVVFRLSLRNTLRAIRRKGVNLRYVLTVGEGASLETLIARLDKFPEMGLKVTGALTNESSRAKTIAGKPVLGHFGDIEKIIQKTKVDQLLIALPRHEYGELDRILAAIKNETVEIRLIPDVHEYVTLGCEIEDFDGFPVININDSPLMGWGAIIKRLTDIAISGAALVILSPILLAIALLVKLSSRGPVLYPQVRMGLDGKTFNMYKFRSMRMDAESETGAVWAKKDDGRKTSIGSFLRATSLDELPQLWNVFRGNMSVVGPRPERPVFVTKFKTHIPHYMLRHKVKAGMTGWAQIHGWRGDTSLEKRIEFDLYYIRNWSYFLDLKIIISTFWKGFINKNAY